MAKGRASKGPRRGRRHQTETSGFVLTIVAGANEGREYYFEEVAAIGRVEDNDVVLIEPGVSRLHARVYAEHGVYMLDDLESANGTRLNGERVAASSEVLRDGDYISVGQTTLQFSALDTSAAGTATAETRLSSDDSRAPRMGRTRTFAGLLKIAFLLALCGLSLGIWRGWLRPQRLGSSNRSGEALAYSDSDRFFHSVFGYGSFDRTHPHRVIVEFEHLLGARVTLLYSASAIDTPGEVLIELNGSQVGHVPVTGPKWRYGMRLTLPPEKLRAGRGNRLVFDNVHNPPADETWELCYLQIIQEVVPKADAYAAERHYALAKKTWQRRAMNPANYSAAWRAFGKAEDLLFRSAPPPPLAAEVARHRKEVDRELTRIFEEGLFSARRAEKFEGDLARAKRAIRHAMRYLPKQDFRFRALKRYLDALGRANS